MSLEELDSLHSALVRRPTVETIACAIECANKVGQNFKTCKEVLTVAKVLAHRDLGCGVKSVSCMDPTNCLVMSHLETFLTKPPGNRFHVSQELKDEVLEQVRPWQSKTVACKPCPYSSVGVLREPDPCVLCQANTPALYFRCEKPCPEKRGYAPSRAFATSAQ